MAGERVKLMVQKRTRLGSAESRRLRRQGFIPGILYGRGDPQPFTVVERDLRAALTTSAGTHAVLDVVLDGDGGDAHASVLKEVQQDAIRGRVIHVDLHEVRLDRPIQASVSVTLVGEPAGLKEGGVLSQPTTEVNVEALPLEIPEHLEFDVSEMHIGDTARLSELQVPEGVTLLDDPEQTVLANVTQPTRVEEPEEAVEEGEVPEGEVPEGEQPEGAAEAAEPGGEDTGES